VSTASPYRHFADRDHLLAAVGAQAALELADRIRTEVEEAAPIPRSGSPSRPARTCATSADRGAGLNVIFSGPLTSLDQTELAGAGRQLISLLLGLAEAAGDTPGPEQALLLLERHIVTAHGYVTLYRDGFFTTGIPPSRPSPNGPRRRPARYLRR